MSRAFARRLAGLAALALFTAGTIVLPAHHLATHAVRPTAPSDIDVEALTNPETGRVDLGKLAQALGLGSTHDESRPHRHGPGPETEHGAGSLEHLTFALASAALAPVAPVCRAFERVERPLPAYVSQVPGLAFLAVQRAQAPPV